MFGVMDYKSIYSSYKYGTIASFRCLRPRVCLVFFGEIYEILFQDHKIDIK